MLRSIGLLFSFGVVCLVAGCGGSEGTNTMESEDQSAIEAYEASLAEEEAAMDADFKEE